MNHDSTKTILLVEDDVIIAMSEAMTLKKHGFQVVTAHSGDKAIKAIETFPAINLILMDIDLGSGMDGTQAAAMILQRVDLPLIFLSSHTETEVVEKTEGITSYGYIVKNSGEMVLIASIKMAFRLFEARMKEQKKDKALQTSEKRYRDLFENAPLAIFQTGLTGNVLAVNTQFARMFGFESPGEIYTSIKDVSELYADPQRRQEIILLRAENPELTTFENLYRRKDGSTFLGRLNARAITDAEGRVLSFEGFIEDITKYQQAMTELAETQTFLKAAIEQSPIPTVLSKIDGTVMILNQAALEILGIEDEAEIKPGINVLTMKRSWQTIDSDGRPLKPQEIPLALAILQGKVTKNRELKIRRKDGTERWQLVDAVPIYDQDGNRSAGLLVCPDITVRKQAEEGLREGEERYKSLFQNNRAVMLIIDPKNAAIIDANPAACAYYGWSHKELLKKSIDEINTLTLEEVQAEMQLAVAEKRNHFLFNHRRANGSIRDVEVYSGPLVIGGRTLLYSITHDITDRKQVEDELRQSEERFRKVFEQGVFGMAMPDQTFHLVKVNAAFCTMFGYSEQELSHLTFKDITHPDHVGTDLENVMRLTRGDISVYQTEKRYITKNGRVIWGAINLSLLRDANGNFLYYLVIIQDITALKEAEAKLARALEEKSILFSELQHRVKNTFTLIDSFVNLEAKQTQEPGIKAVLEKIHLRVYTLANLYSKLYVGGEETLTLLHKYLVDVAKTIVSVFGNSSKSVELRLDLDEMTIGYKNASAFGLILNELIINALKHAFPDNRQGIVSVRFKKENGSVILEVADNGVGLPKDFDLNVSPSLGLKLVQVLAQQLGGEVYFDRTETTTFGIRTSEKNLS